MPKRRKANTTAAFEGTLRPDASKEKNRRGLIAINANSTSATIHNIASMRMSDAVIVDHRHARPSHPPEEGDECSRRQRLRARLGVDSGRSKYAVGLVWGYIG